MQYIRWELIFNLMDQFVQLTLEAETNLLFPSFVDFVRPPVEVVTGLLVLEAVAAPVVLGAVLQEN